jgi:hypothetical protein
MRPGLPFLLAVAALPLFGAAAPASAEMFRLDSIRIDKVPHVQKTSISYVMDLTFQTRPGEYWCYYDTIHQAIVIDFYGATVAPGPVPIDRSRVFRGLSVKNLKSEFSLSGERSQIIIDADPGWHIEAAPAGEKTLRLTVWRQTRHDRPNGKRLIWIYVLSFAIPLVVAAATFLIIRSAMD